MFIFREYTVFRGLESEAVIHAMEDLTGEIFYGENLATYSKDKDGLLGDIENDLRDQSPMICSICEVNICRVKYLVFS